MKDAEFTLEFTTHVLANSIGPEGEKDHFQRDSQGKMIWQQAWWYSAFGQALDYAKVKNIKPGDVHMNLAVEAETELYNRRYGDNQYREHEAIMPGTKVTFNAMVADRVTQSILEQILERMGQYVGLSPYGYRLGFGKFLVVDVKVEAADDSESNSQ